MTERVQTGDGRAGGGRARLGFKQASKLLILRRGRGYRKCKQALRITATWPSGAVVAPVSTQTQQFS